MRIAEICTSHVFHVPSATSVRDAAALMRKCHVGALVVVDAPNGKRVPVGVLTDRDIVVEVVAAGVDPATLTVGDVMSRDPATCAEDDGLLRAIEIMRARGVRRLPVLNAKGSLVGMVTADDIVGGVTRELTDLSSALVHEQVREMQQR